MAEVKKCDHNGISLTSNEESLLVASPLYGWDTMVAKLDASLNVSPACNVIQNVSLEELDISNNITVSNISPTFGDWGVFATLYGISNSFGEVPTIEKMCISTDLPSISPTAAPTAPTQSPTSAPTAPTRSPTLSPTNQPSTAPSRYPTLNPTSSPTAVEEVTAIPSGNPRDANITLAIFAVILPAGLFLLILLTLCYMYRKHRNKQMLKPDENGKKMSERRSRRRSRVMSNASPRNHNMETRTNNNNSSRHSGEISPRGRSNYESLETVLAILDRSNHYDHISLPQPSNSGEYDQVPAIQTSGYQQLNLLPETIPQNVNLHAYGESPELLVALEENTQQNNQEVKLSERTLVEHPLGFAYQNHASLAEKQDETTQVFRPNN